MQKKDNTPLAVAFILIAIGLIWIFRQVNGFPFFHHINLHQFIFPFRHYTDGFVSFLFSWQMILIYTGMLLMAGRRSSGIFLMVVGGVFLIPKLMHLSFFSLPFLIPAILITIGIVLILKASLI